MVIKQFEKFVCLFIHAALFFCNQAVCETLNTSFGERILWTSKTIEAGLSGKLTAAKLTMSDFQLSPARVTEIQVIDDNEVIIARFNPPSFDKPELETPWLYRTGPLRVRLIGEGELNDMPPIRITPFLVADPDINAYGMVPTFFPPSSLNDAGYPGKWVSEPIALLQMWNGAVCSAVAFRSNGILTARHCFDGLEEDCKSVKKIRFDYDRPDAVGATSECKDIKSVGQADAILIKVRTIPKKLNGSERRPLELRSEALKPGERAKVLLVHHPAGLPKVVSRCCEAWIDPNDLTLYHSCGSMKGSSGGALIDLQGRLIGINSRSQRDENMSDLYLAEKLEEGKIYSNKAISAWYIVNEIGKD